MQEREQSLSQLAQRQSTLSERLNLKTELKESNAFTRRIEQLDPWTQTPKIIRLGKARIWLDRSILEVRNRLAIIDEQIDQKRGEFVTKALEFESEIKTRREQLEAMEKLDIPTQVLNQFRQRFLEFEKSPEHDLELRAALHLLNKTRAEATTQNQTQESIPTETTDKQESDRLERGLPVITFIEGGPDKKSTLQINNERTIKLAPLEEALVRFLYQNPNKFFTTDQLFTVLKEAGSLSSLNIIVNSTVSNIQKRIGGEVFSKNESIDPKTGKKLRTWAILQKTPENQPESVEVKKPIIKILDEAEGKIEVNGKQIVIKPDSILWKAFLLIAENLISGKNIYSTEEINKIALDSGSFVELSPGSIITRSLRNKIDNNQSPKIFLVEKRGSGVTLTINAEIDWPGKTEQVNILDLSSSDNENSQKEKLSAEESIILSQTVKRLAQLGPAFPSLDLRLDNSILDACDAIANNKRPLNQGTSLENNNLESILNVLNKSLQILTIGSQEDINKRISEYEENLQIILIWITYHIDQIQLLENVLKKSLTKQTLTDATPVSMVGPSYPVRLNFISEADMERIWEEVLKQKTSTPGVPIHTTTTQGENPTLPINQEDTPITGDSDTVSEEKKDTDGSDGVNIGSEDLGEESLVPHQEISEAKQSSRMSALLRRDPKIVETIYELARIVNDRLTADLLSSNQINRVFQRLKKTLFENLTNGGLITPSGDKEIPQYTKADVVIIQYIELQRQKGGGFQKRFLATLNEIVQEQFAKLEQEKNRQYLSGASGK